MPTIRDVAERAGVSIATVSAVISEAAWVTEETRTRVRRSIREIGYRPNRLARGLKTRQSYSVGVIVSDLTNPFFTELVRSLGHVLREHGRNLILCDSEHRFDLGDRNLDMLLEKQVDGLVIVGDSVRRETVQAYVSQKEHVPVVSIERDYALEGVNALLIDSEDAAYRATRHLIAQVGGRIGLIAGPSAGAGSTTYARLSILGGYRRALRDAGLPADPALVVEGDFRFTGGARAMRQLLALPAPPRAVFASNDLMALGAIQAAREAGYAVPEDLAVVGFDDIPLAAHTYPPLSTLSNPIEELGEAAAEVLLSQFGHPPAAPSVRRLFTTRLVVRQSSEAAGGSVPDNL